MRTAVTHSDRDFDKIKCQFEWLLFFLMRLHGIRNAADGILLELRGKCL